MSTEIKACPMCGTDAPLETEQCNCGYIFSGPNGSNEAVEYDPASSITTASESWQTAGWAISLIGALGLALSLFMKTSVETSGLYGASSGVVNLDLQFHKGLAVAGSLFAIGVGAFCFGIGAVVGAIDRGRP